MLKKILIMSMLLISGLNAENSLAEEAALKKQQEQEQQTQEQYGDQEFTKIISERIKKFNEFNTQLHEKYLIKKSDTQEIIENKYKNRIQLYAEMSKNINISCNEYNNIHDLITEYSETYAESYPDRGFNSKMEEKRREFLYLLPSPLFSYRVMESEAFEIFYVSDSFIGNHYFDPAWGRSTDTSKIDCAFIRNDEDTKDAYINYIKDAYSSYETRKQEEQAKEEEKIRLAQEQKEREIQRVKQEQENKIRYAQMDKKSEMERAQAQKQQQLSLANEKKERQRVQGACQAWKTKANRMVYSLGVGDKVMKNSAVFIIQGANANTFLVNALGYNIYLQKSDCIAYEALKSAPSPYCYQ